MDPAKMKVVDLRTELGALGLDTKGNKPALVERLKKALETKLGSAIPDTSILDTSTEDTDDVSTPRRPGPAARTRRRSSSSRLAATPAKIARREVTPPPIVEEAPKDESEPEPSPKPSPSPPEPELESPPLAKSPSPVKTQSPVREASPERLPSPVKAVTPEKPPTPVKAPEPVEAPKPVPKPVEAPVPVPAPIIAAEKKEDVQSDDRSSSPTQTNKPDSDSLYQIDDVGKGDDLQPKDEANQEGDNKGVKGEQDTDDRKPHQMTEEEEWEELNKKLKKREAERLEREKKQAEDDKAKLEAVQNDPIKLNRLMRKQEKKQRWSNFYKSVEITNEVLAPLVEEASKDNKKKEEVAKVVEPEIDENKLTLSWYDSDLNQYLELPELNSVVPLSEGAFAHAWAGARASHGVGAGRYCFEVRLGAPVSTTETTEKEGVAHGIRVGWSTVDSSLHLGEGELSWGFESTGRAVNNSEFKEYGKQINEKDVVGAYLDLESNPCRILYTINGEEQGTAYEFDKGSLEGKALFPHVLTKNMCYSVNMGYDKYNMITKTKIVRNRQEVPVEQVLEEKRVREEQIKKEKEEKDRLFREKKERIRKEREERQRKRREEREKQEKERKEKELAERRAKGEEIPEEVEGEGDKIQDSEMPQEPVAAQDDVSQEPKENGDKPEEPAAAEEKPEPMETDEGKPQDAGVKSEPEGEIPEVTEEQVYGGLVLDKRIKFVIRHTVSEELDGSEVELLADFQLVSGALLAPDTSALQAGPRPPPPAQAEVILMVGMPGSGKTYWARQHAAAHPEKRYNILSTGSLFDKMKVDCKPFKATYEGRWDAMVSKCAKCVLKLLEVAQGRRRNFILDQTNVYPSAQRRKLREFDGYRRLAVVIVTDDETYRERQKLREEADGKEVPDGAIIDMKANFTLPEKSQWIDEVLYPELNEEEAKKIIEGFHKEAKAAGVVKEKERRDRSESRDGNNKRNRSNDKRHSRDDRRNRDFNRERDGRWGGGGGGGRGGRGGGGGHGGHGGSGHGGHGGGGHGGHGGGWGRGGSRWGAAGGGGPGGGPRDRSNSQQRFDRNWGPPPNRNDMNRDRDSFRGRGGPQGPRGGGGGPPRGGPMVGRAGPDNRFSRDNRPPRNNAPPGGGGGNMGSGGGGGSWRGAGQNNRQPPMRGNNKDSGGGPSGQDQQQNWNQWAGNWGNWGNWNQNQAANQWNQWGNWNNWNNQQQQATPNAGGAGAATPAVGGGAGAAGGGAGGAPGGGGGQVAAGKQQQQAAQQWNNNYTAQQWYQWQQWQQQQWQQQGYGGQQAGAGSGASADAATQQQAWAQYYQNYGGGNNAANAGNAVANTDKK